MFCIPNQSSLPKAYTQFTDEGDETSRLLPSSNRDRLVDCMEEFVKYTIIMRPQFKLFGDRFSERKERRTKLESQAEAEEVDSAVINNLDHRVQSAGVAVDNVNGVNVARI